jgi:hypothetical protein
MNDYLLVLLIPIFIMLLDKNSTVVCVSREKLLEIMKTNKGGTLIIRKRYFHYGYTFYCDGVVFHMTCFGKMNLSFDVKTFDLT